MYKYLFIMDYYKNIHWSYVYSALYEKRRVYVGEYIEFAYVNHTYSIEYQCLLQKKFNFQFTREFHRDREHISKMLDRKILANYTHASTNSVRDVDKSHIIYNHKYTYMYLPE